MFDWSNKGNLDTAIYSKPKTQMSKDDSRKAQGNHSEDEAHKVDMAANKNPVTGERMGYQEVFNQIGAPTNAPVLKTAYVANQGNMQVPKAGQPKNEVAGSGFKFKKPTNTSAGKNLVHSGVKNPNQQINELEYMAAMAQGRPAGDPKQPVVKPSLPKKW